MIYSYGISMRGARHIKNGTVCQDAHRIIKVSGNTAVAAAADGLGSQKYSDTASKLAVNTAAEYCAQRLWDVDADGDNDAEILQCIKESFAAAQDAIEAAAEASGGSPDEYDTTLSLAVLTGGGLYYGHSGDSGIIAHTESGEFIAVTEQQRDADGNVFPMFFRDKWAFGRFGQRVGAVLLATDGVFEAVCRDTDMAKFFADNRSLKIDIIGEDAARARAEEYLAAIPEESINDDKTVAVLIDTGIVAAAAPQGYYGRKRLFMRLFGRGSNN